MKVKDYYNWIPGIEAIDVLRHFNFNLGNAMKYIWRCGRKDASTALADLDKAIDYLKDERERVEGENFDKFHDWLTSSSMFDEKASSEKTESESESGYSKYLETRKEELERDLERWRMSGERTLGDFPFLYKQRPFTIPFMQRIPPEDADKIKKDGPQSDFVFNKQPDPLSGVITSNDHLVKAIAANKTSAYVLDKESHAVLSVSIEEVIQDFIHRTPDQRKYCKVETATNKEMDNDDWLTNCNNYCQCSEESECTERVELPLLDKVVDEYRSLNSRRHINIDSGLDTKGVGSRICLTEKEFKLLTGRSL